MSNGSVATRVAGSEYLAVGFLLSDMNAAEVEPGGFEEIDPLGEPCSFVNDCVAGLFCTLAEYTPGCDGEWCCVTFCDLSDPSCPQPGGECYPFFGQDAAPEGYEDVGACLVAN